MDIQYKTVKNSKYPGRPPSGCVWVKDGDTTKTNSKGEVAYRKAKPAELQAKKAKAKKPRKKRTAIEGNSSDVRTVFLRKRSYNELTFEELEQVGRIVTAKIEAKKESERASLQKQIEKLKGKLGALKS